MKKIFGYYVSTTDWQSKAEKAQEKASALLVTREAQRDNLATLSAENNKLIARVNELKKQNESYAKTLADTHKEITDITIQLSTFRKKAEFLTEDKKESAKTIESLVSELNFIFKTCMDLKQAYNRGDVAPGIEAWDKALSTLDCWDNSPIRPADSIIMPSAIKFDGNDNDNDTLRYDNNKAKANNNNTTHKHKTNANRKVQSTRPEAGTDSRGGKKVASRRANRKDDAPSTGNTGTK